MTILAERSVPGVQPATRDWRILLPGITLLSILLVRLIDLNYNSAFVDEAIYILNGQEALAGTSGFVGIRYMFGSYFYPVLVALFGHLFGNELLGARMLSALCTTVAAAAVYLLTRRLTGELAGLLAMVLFGFASNSRLVGQLATYDTLSIALLAVAAALLTLGLTDQQAERQDRFCFYAGVSFALAVLAKYFALLVAPVVALLLAGLWLQRDHMRVRLLLRVCLLPAALILVAYGILFLDDLLLFVVGVRQYASQPAPRMAIITTLVEALWPYALLALPGTVILALIRPLGWRIAALLLLAGAMVPVYHALASNARSMDKHIVYSLVFLTPLAGIATAQVVEWPLRLQSAHRLRQPLTLTQSLRRRVAIPVTVQAICVIALGGAWLAINQRATQEMKLLWPNMEPTIAFTRALPVSEGAQVLAEGGPTYALYVDWNGRAEIIDTWSTTFRYADQQGSEALVAGVTDRVFDYVILDSYYTPELSYRLSQAAQIAGYRVIHQDSLPISNGSLITITIYAAPGVATEFDHAQS